MMENGNVPFECRSQDKRVRPYVRGHVWGGAIQPLWAARAGSEWEFML